MSTHAIRFPGDQSLPFLSFGGARYKRSQVSNFPVGSFTISCWIKVKEGGTLFFYGDPEAQNFNACRLSLVVDSSITVNVAMSTGVTANLPLDDNAHHVAMTWQQNNPSDKTARVDIYVDGISVAGKDVLLNEGSSMPEQIPKLASNGALYVATNRESNDEPLSPSAIYSGELSDFRIWSKVLSPTEIAQDVYAKVLGNEQDLYLALPLIDEFIDWQQNQALDLSLNKYHAQMPTIEQFSPCFGYLSSFNNFPIIDRTVSFWLRCGMDASGKTLVSYSDMSSSDRPNSANAWVISNADNLTVAGISTEISLIDGDWHHVAIVVHNNQTDSAELLVYVDGINRYQKKYQEDELQTGMPFVLAAPRGSDDYDEIFTGQMYDFRIWSRARSQQEIFADMSSPLEGEQDGLISYTPLLPDQQSFITPSAGNVISIQSPYYRGGVKSLASMVKPRAMQLNTSQQGMRVTKLDIGAIDFSFECWIKTSKVGPILVLADDLLSPPKNVKATLYVISENTLSFGTSDGSKSIVQQFSTQTTNVIDDQWHHVAAIRLANELQLYLDGILIVPVIPIVVQSGDIPLDLGNAQTLTIGFSEFSQGANELSLIPSTDAQFEGSIAEIRLWSRALIEGEIRGGMHHYLKGDEPGLIGHWAFGHGSGLDTSPMDHHGVILPGTLFSFDMVDLEPRDKPYIVAQTKLMEDYAFIANPDQSITPQAQTTYRVILNTYDANGGPLANQPLRITLQDEFFTGSQSGLPSSDIVNLVIETSKGSENIDLTKTPAHIRTNALGRVSFAFTANGKLSAPVIRVHAPFMEQNHNLLVFPDRHAHHTLANITQEQLLGQPRPGNSVDIVPLLDKNKPDNAKSIASAVNHLMKPVSLSATQSQHPITRKRDQQLLGLVAPEKIRHYENAYIAPIAYNQNSDVCAGHAMLTDEPIMRSVASKKWPAWKLTHVLDGSSPNFGNISFNPIVDDSPDNIKMELSNYQIETQDTLAKRCLENLSLTRNSSLSMTKAQLDDLLADSSQQRGFFDFVSEIGNAVHVIVHTAEIVLTDVENVAHVIIVVVADAANKAKAAVIHTVHQAVAAVEGVFKKVEVTMEQVVDLVKDLFTWSDILKTQEFIENDLKSIIPFVKNQLISSQLFIDKQLKTIVDLADDKFTHLEKNIMLQNLASSKSKAVYGQPQGVRTSYVHQKLADHIHDTKPINSTLSVPAAQDDFFSQLKAIASNHQMSKDKYNNQINKGTNLIKSTNNSTEMVIVDLLEVIKTVFDDMLLMAASVDNIIVSELESLLDDIDVLLQTELDIPIVTPLYEQVITEGRQKLNFYSLAALLGAIPMTIGYKLSNNNAVAPYAKTETAIFPHLFPWPIDDRGNVIQSRERYIDPSNPDWVKTNLGLGGAFGGLILISGLLSTIDRTIDGFDSLIPFGQPNPELQKFTQLTLAFEWLLQLSQLPLNSFNKLSKSETVSAAAVIEVIVWFLQFIPPLANTITSHHPQNTDSEVKKIVFTVWGCVHAAFFTILYLVEMLDEIPKAYPPGSPDSPTDAYIDSSLKFLANFVSCFPEAVSMFDSESSIEYDALAFLIWDAVTWARFGFDVDAHLNFSPR